MAIIQIAGALDITEAKMLSEIGANWIGFPLKLDVHAADISEHEAKSIIAEIHRYAQPVLITYLNQADEIDSLCKYLRVCVVQLHGTVSTAELIKLRKLNNSLYVIKSLVVKKHNLAELEFMVGELSSLVDAFITDTYDPVTGASGATGKSHDWAISRRLVDISPRPVILAGGLRPENLREAILTVRPFGVDVHTGVEGVDGRKAEYLVRDFITIATAAFIDINRIENALFLKQSKEKINASLVNN